MNITDNHLFDSVAINSTAGVAEAIAQGCDVNARDTRQGTPLHYASDQPLIVRPLLDAGADPNVSNDLGRTPLHGAVSDPETNHSNRRDVLTALLQAGADPNVSDHRGQTPLHDAATLPRETATPVRQLLDAGADPTARDELGNLPLHYAAAHPAEYRAKAVDYLLNAGDGVNIQNNSGKTPLHWAAARPGRDQAQTIGRLLQAGADPTTQDQLGNLPLHYAAAAAGETRAGAVGHLLKTQLGVNAQNHSGNTPLHNAVLHAGEGQAKTIACLLDAGADPTLTNPRGESPLDLAASLKNPVAQTILEQRITQAEPHKQRPSASPASLANTPAQHPQHPASAYHRNVAACLIRQCRTATAPWQKYRTPGQHVLPRSIATGREYQGGNSLYLMAIAHQKGYSDPRWGTFEQIKAAGGIVRKGEQSTKIVWWDFSRTKEKVPVTDREGKPILDDKGEPVLHHQGPHFRLYSVFNVEQARNLKLEPLMSDKPSWKVHQDADALIKATGVKITHVRAGWSFYQPKTDTMTLPSPSYLRDPESYYQAANRELAHATGHESRMNRDTLRDGLEAGPGSSPSNREALRAEIAAVMTNTRLGVGHRTVLDGGACVSIAKTIAENPMEVHFAARDAQKISDHLINPIRERLHDKEQKPAQLQPNAERPAPEPTPARPSLPDQMKTYRQTIPSDHVVLEAKPTTNLPGGPIAYKFEGHPMPQDLKGLAKKDFGYNQVIAHAPLTEVQNHFRTLPEAERPTFDTGPSR